MYAPLSFDLFGRLWPRRPTPPPPAPRPEPPPLDVDAIVEQRVGELATALRREMEAAIVAQAELDMRERQKLADIINTLAEDNEAKGRLITRLQKDAEARLAEIQKLLAEQARHTRLIASLQTKLSERDKSLREQGKRIGELERQNTEIPALRAAAWWFEMVMNIYLADATEVRRLMMQAGLIPPPPPIIPERSALSAAAAVPGVGDPLADAPTLDVDEVSDAGA